MTRMTRVLTIVSTLVGLTYVASADEHKQSMTADGERALQQVYFDLDSAEVGQDLLMVANQLQCTPKQTIILDAYTDPTGTDAYNADLALRRAKAVRDQLVYLGIDPDRIMLGIFGERGVRRDTHRHDRRVEIRTSAEPVAVLEARRQGNAIAVIDPGQAVEEVALP